MIVKASILLTMQSGRMPLRNAAVVFDHGLILEVGPAAKMIAKYPWHQMRTFDNAVLLPGLVNTHTHLELPPLLEKLRAKSFSDWVMNLIHIKKEMQSKDYEQAVINNIATIIQSGTTTVGEICTHNISPLLLKQSGLRSLIYKEIIAMNPLYPAPRLSSIFHRSSSLIQNGLSPHTPYTVSQAVLRSIVQLSREKRIRLSMHIAESRDEIMLLHGQKSGLQNIYRFAGWDPAWAPRGVPSFEYLHRIGVLSSSLLAVHAVHVTDQDISVIKKSNVSVAHCPRSNAETRVGRMPLKKFLDAGIRVGLGTDSLASSPSLNLWDEMRYAYRIHRREGITPTDILAMATSGAARALGMEGIIGTIAPGKKADLIAVAMPNKDTGALSSDLLRETKSCIMSMVNGKIIFQK